MFGSKTVNLALTVGILVISLVSLLLSLHAYSCIRKKLSFKSVPNRRLRILKNICFAFIPINICALLFSITSLITLFFFINTSYYSFRGFEGDYYPGGIALAIAPILISLLGLIFCGLAYAKSAAVLKEDVALLETDEQKTIE